MCMLDPKKKEIYMDYLKAAAVIGWMPFIALSVVVIYHWLH